MRKMADSYLQDAKSCLDEAKQALVRNDYARVVSRSQECVQYAVKAFFEALEISYPFIHDMGPQLLLLKESERLPDDIRKNIPKIASITTSLASKRIIARYGDQRAGIPARELFTKSDAEKAMKDASLTYNKIKKFLSKL